MKSKFLSLNKRDFLHGLVIPCALTIATIIYKMIMLNSFPTSLRDWVVILGAGVGSQVLVYLNRALKNSDGDYGKEKEIM
jgi:hypothetical protein